MRVPRDLSEANLTKRLGRFGYRVTHLTGIHLRLTHTVRGEHHITIPNHDLLRLGTLARVAAHHGRVRDEFIQRLFD